MNLQFLKFLLLLLPVGGVEITELTLTRAGQPVAYIDASSDAPEQELNFAFSLEDGESFSSLEVQVEGATAATADSQGAVQYFSPFSEASTELTVNVTAQLGSLLYLQPSLLFKGEYTLLVTSDLGQDQRMDLYYGFKKCETGWRIDQNLNVSSCTIRISGGCSGNGTVYPAPYVARAGLYSDLLGDYLSASASDVVSEGAFVQGEAEEDGSFPFAFTEEISYSVGSSTPKELLLRAEILHGAEDVFASEVESLTASDERVLDAFEDEGAYTIFNSEGCMDWTAFCEDPETVAQPPLPGNVILDPNMRCLVPPSGQYESVENTCRTDLVPKESNVQEMELALFCDLRCDIDWGLTGPPKNKTLFCEPGSNTWQEPDLPGIYLVMKGIWPTCDCSNRDSFVETDGGGGGAAVSISWTLSLAAAVFGAAFGFAE